MLAFAVLLVSCAPAAPTVEINGIAVPPLPTLHPPEVTRGAELYGQYCSQCHGQNLEGQPNWRQPDAEGNLPAPPHDATGHTWHHPDEELIRIVQAGGGYYGGTMPAFEDELTSAEVEAILSFIKSHWGQDEREFQWWITVREN